MILLRALARKLHAEAFVVAFMFRVAGTNALCDRAREVGSIMAESLNSAISREGWDLTLRISLGLRPECGGARDSEELWQTRFLFLRT